MQALVKNVFEAGPAPVANSLVAVRSPCGTLCAFSASSVLDALPHPRSIPLRPSVAPFFCVTLLLFAPCPHGTALPFFLVPALCWMPYPTHAQYLCGSLSVWPASCVPLSYRAALFQRRWRQRQPQQAQGTPQAPHGQERTGESRPLTPREMPQEGRARRGHCRVHPRDTPNPDGRAVGVRQRWRGVHQYWPAVHPTTMW